MGRRSRPLTPARSVTVPRRSSGRGSGSDASRIDPSLVVRADRGSAS